jgi:hypothetical protein
MKKSDTMNTSAHPKPTAKKPASKAPPPAIATPNWGTEAAKTVARFRRIWEKEGAKLA